MTLQDDEIRTAGQWFIANQAGPLTDEDAKAFMAWLRASPIHVKEYLDVARLSRHFQVAAGDPEVPLQREDRESYRYHPLLLNAAFLGSLSEEDCRILGFGDKTNYRPAFEQVQRYRIHLTLSRVHDVNLRLQELRLRVATRFSRRSTRARP